jgi:predicted transcriptional regulator
MRQLIARIDERLHERLKRVAKREGRSVNSIVIESLTRTVDELDRPETAQEWKARMIAEGRVVVPPEPDGPGLSREELLELSREWGSAISEQLERDRRKDYW